MLRKIKYALCFLAVSVIMTSANFENFNQIYCYENDESEDSVSETAESEETDYIIRTEKEVLSSMILACENDKQRLYYSETEDILALENKKTGYIWWSSPINAEADNKAKGQSKKELESTMVIVYGEPATRSTSTMRSAKNGKISYQVQNNTLKVTYRYPAGGFIIPVEYSLGDDFLCANINTENIKENKADEDSPKLLLEISLLPNITATGENDKGYYIIPDGSGAVINFNNGKQNAKAYSGQIYGNDITAVSLNKSAVTEQIYLPVYAAVKEDGNGMLAVLSKGDANAKINAAVSTMSKTSYNLCSSRFILRSTDTYYMNNEPLTVFESGSIDTPSLEIRYYPLAEESLNYSDVAAVYRNYLISECKVTQKENNNSLYIDIYGGAEKKEPVCGIPVTRKKAFTTYSQAQEILAALKEYDIQNITLRYDNWTDNGIENKVDVKAAPSSVLGSKKDFDTMLEFCKENNISCYPSVDNKTFESGNGYMTFNSAAVRVSGQYSRQLSYSLAYGTEDGMKDAVSLLSPALLPEIFSKLAENYSETGGICMGSASYQLYGDYGKNKFSRNDMKCSVEKGFEECSQKAGSVLAETANAYVVPYTDHITDVPLSSSKFDIFDGDIPFYQIVFHGIVPYSSKAVNGSADSEQLFLQAVAAGSGLNYDLIYEEISELKDTVYDKYFYAKYNYWISTIAAEYKLWNDILENVKDDTIADYYTDGNSSVTVYSSGKTVKVDYNTCEINFDGKIYKLEDYKTGEGALIF